MSLDRNTKNIFKKTHVRVVVYVNYNFCNEDYLEANKINQRSWIYKKIRTEFR